MRHVFKLKHNRLKNLDFNTDQNNGGYDYLQDRSDLLSDLGQCGVHSAVVGGVLTCTRVGSLSVSPPGHQHHRGDQCGQRSGRPPGGLGSLHRPLAALPRPALQDGHHRGHLRHEGWHKRTHTHTDTCMKVATHTLSRARTHTHRTAVSEHLEIRDLHLSVPCQY